jgi:hypothetical protein
MHSGRPVENVRSVRLAELVLQGFPHTGDRSRGVGLCSFRGPNATIGNWIGLRFVLILARLDEDAR